MSKKSIVIYKSKTGFAERFAKWISEELSCDIVPYEKRNTVHFPDYDIVIYGGGIYAGSIGGLKWFKEILPALSGKKVIVFASGATPADSPAAVQTMRQNFTGDEWSNVKAYYFQGGLNYEKMGFGSKLMMSMFRRMLKKQEGGSEAYRAVASSYDCTSKEAVKPLIADCLN